MKIQNPMGKTLEELETSLSIKYPGTKIRKAFLGIGPRSLIMPSGNMKYVLRDAKTKFITDFVPPVLVIIIGIVVSIILTSIIMSFIYGQLMLGIGGALWVVLGLFIVKEIYKSANKEQFNTFYDDVNQALNKSADADSIF